MPCDSVASPVAGASCCCTSVEDRGGHDQKFSVTIGCCDRAILSCSFMIASITVSGRGGQPGT